MAGGAGFIGTNLIRRFLGKKYFVTCIDDFSTGSLSNLHQFNSDSNFQSINHDVRNVFPSMDKVDAVFNLACPASPPMYQKDPIGTLMTNVLGTLNALEFARAHQAKIFQASTSEIYGNPLEHPQNEEYFGNVNTIGPRSCYDEGKRAAETLCSDFERNYDVKVIIFRIFNTYGPWMSNDDGRVVSNFITQALENKPITIYGDGKQTRSFCYVDDLIHAFDLSLNSEFSQGCVMNLGNPDEITMLDLANKIIEITDSTSKLVFKDLPVDDPTRRKPDISRAKNYFAWEPKVSLDYGLSQTIDYFRNED